GVETLTRLSSVLLAETKLDLVLSLVAALARQTIRGAESVSVTLVQDGRMTTPASTGTTASRIDRVQYQMGRGPCVDAARSGEEIHVQDLRRDPRWPRVRAEALALGIESILSVPVVV